MKFEVNIPRGRPSEVSARHLNISKYFFFTNFYMPKNRPFLPFLVYFLLHFFSRKRKRNSLISSRHLRGTASRYIHLEFHWDRTSSLGCGIERANPTKKRKNWDGPPQNGARPPKKLWKIGHHYTIIWSKFHQIPKGGSIFNHFCE